MADYILSNWLKELEQLLPGTLLELGAWHTVQYSRELSHSRIQDITRFCSKTRLLASNLSEPMRRALLWYSQLLDFVFNTLQPWRYNPVWWNPFQGIDRFINDSPYPPHEKLSMLLPFLKNLPHTIQSLKNLLLLPTKASWQTALLKINGMIEFTNNAIKQLCYEARKKGEWKIASKAENAAQQALIALQNWHAWLEEKFKHNKTWHPERLDEPIYRKLWSLQLDLPFSPEEALKLANQEAEKLHEQLREETYRAYNMPPEEAIPYLCTKLSLSKQSWFLYLKKNLEELRSFLLNQDVLPSLEDIPPLKVRELPPFMRGAGAGASVSPASAYSPQSPVYYNVEPINTLAPQLIESFLKEYNSVTLQILNIHEAYPGHYIHLAFAQKYAHPATMITSCDTTTEGWAVYAEHLMDDLGWNSSPEWKVLYGKWYLRVITNTILDIRFHLEGISEQEALRFLTQEAFQEKAEATLKIHRQKLSAVQLASYFTGLLWIQDLRSRWLSANRNKGLKDFHSWFLTLGPLPPSAIKTTINKG